MEKTEAFLLKVQERNITKKEQNVISEVLELLDNKGGSITICGAFDIVTRILYRHADLMKMFADLLPRHLSVHQEISEIGTLYWILRSKRLEEDVDEVEFPDYLNSALSDKTGERRDQFRHNQDNSGEHSGVLDLYDEKEFPKLNTNGNGKSTK